MASILTTAKKMYTSFRGFHTDRKLIVIESDDWGSIRMPSEETLRQLEKTEEVTDAFLRFDSLERYEDVERVIDSISKIKDKNGNSPCITANFAVANPDFDRIDIKSGTYHYEVFTETYNRYGEEKDILGLIRSGADKNVFLPQLHTLEHLNVNRWINALKEGKKDAEFAFEHRMIGTQSSFSAENYFGYMDALNYDDPSELSQIESRLDVAFSIFKNSFGYDSETFVAPCHVWSESIEPMLKKHNVCLMQTGEWQNDFSNVKGTEKGRRKLHYTGEINRKTGLLYSVRNCNFEPAISGNVNKSINSCLLAIQKAFKNRKPAIINSHRLNYMGRICEENGVGGCEALCTVLKKTLELYADVEFMSSADLTKLMLEEK